MGDGDLATPAVERSGDVLIAVGRGFEGATGTSPPRPWSGETMSSSPWEWL